MKFTFYGHACFAVEVSGKKLLFDPFITGNELAKDIDINKIEADYILVSHGHGDHVGDLMAIAKNTGATVISNAEITSWVLKQGHEKVHPMNFGARDFDFGKVHYVPAIHSSGLPDGSYGGNPGGFVIRTEEINFYFAGDTCLTMDMQLIPRYTKLDVAILPIGGNFTMDAEEASIAAEFVQCDKVVGVHFDTFGYIVIDHDKAVNIFKQKGKELMLPEIGKTIEIGR
jgi:L-ascorbate metabolism protein UlaG (beta-lactamase superfamily)